MVHHHHHDWNAWEQWRGGRQAGKTRARSTFANNKQHKAAGYCPAVARLPDKAKDLGCLFKIVSCLFSLVTCLFEIVNIWSSVLCSHIMPLFWPDTWSPLIQYNFQNTAMMMCQLSKYSRGTLIGRIKKTHSVVFFQTFSFFNSFGIPTVLRVNGPMVCCGFKLQEAQISVEQFKSFFEAQTGWLWGIQRRVKLVKHCFAMVLQYDDGEED